MEFFRKIKFAVLIAVIPAVFALTGNALFNLHIHKQANGSLLVHAHPFHTNNNGNSHSHTSHDCASIQQLTSFFFIFASVFALSCIFSRVYKRIELKFIDSNFGFTASLLNNRPPPTFA